MGKDVTRAILKPDGRLPLVKDPLISGIRAVPFVWMTLKNVFI